MTYHALLQQLDDWFADAVSAIGPDVVLCRRGCAACCHGPFDISPADAQQVAGALARLDPAKSEGVRQRALRQVEAYRTIAPGWKAPWNVDILSEDTFDRICDALATERCPALSADETCLIYDDRPSNCRMIGLPIVTPQGDTIENACPIVATDARYAALPGVRFDLGSFEEQAERCDAVVEEYGWVRTTVAGAIVHAAERGDSGHE